MTSECRSRASFGNSLLDREMDANRALRTGSRASARFARQFGSGGNEDAMFVDFCWFVCAAAGGHRVSSLDVVPLLARADRSWLVRPFDYDGSRQICGRIAVAQSSGDHWEMSVLENAPRLSPLLETFLDPSDPSHR